MNPSHQQAQLHLLLLEAVATGNQQAVEKLIQTGQIQINQQHAINKWTALHWACKRGHLTICELLLGSGADPALKTSDGKYCWELLPAEVEPCWISEKFPSSNGRDSARTQAATDSQPNQTKIEHNYMRVPDITPQLKDLVEGRTPVIPCFVPAEVTTVHEQTVLSNHHDTAPSESGQLHDRKEPIESSGNHTTEIIPTQADERELWVYNTDMTLIGSVFIPPTITIEQLHVEIQNQLDVDDLHADYRLVKVTRGPAQSSAEVARVPISTKQYHLTVQRIFRDNADSVLLEPR